MEGCVWRNIYNRLEDALSAYPKKAPYGFGGDAASLVLVAFRLMDINF